jgi:hypothetical protein
VDANSIKPSIHENLRNAVSLPFGLWSRLNTLIHAADCSPLGKLTATRRLVDTHHHIFKVEGKNLFEFVKQTSTQADINQPKQVQQVTDTFTFRFHATAKQSSKRHSSGKKQTVKCFMITDSGFPMMLARNCFSAIVFELLFTWEINFEW